MAETAVAHWRSVLVGFAAMFCLGLLGVTLLTIRSHADADATRDQSVLVDGEHLTWIWAPEMTPETAGCLKLETADRKGTSICVKGSDEADITHRGYRSGYAVPLEHIQSDQRSAVRIRRADLMLRPESMKVEQCVEPECADPVVLHEDLPIEPAVLAQCQAVAPFRTGGVETREKVVALTLDDGPGDLTRDALAVLDKHAIPVTFFVVGVHAERQVPLLREVVQRGHVLANHSYSHLDLSAMGESEVREELASTNDIIAEANGFGSCLMRAPMGEDGGMTTDVAEDLGMVSVNWNAGAHDYLGLSKERIVADTLDLVRPGSIVVLHDGGPREQTIAALPQIIKKLRNQGYRFVTVPELLDLPRAYRSE